MQETAITVAEPRQAATARQDASKPLKVTGKLSDVIDLMVYEGIRYADACIKAGLSTRAARAAFDKPHVLKEIARRKQVFRQHVSAANISRLEQLRDQGDNKMAAIAAIKTLEQIDDEPTQRAGNAAFPGITVIINTSADTPHMHTIDAKPLSDNDGG